MESDREDYGYNPNAVPGIRASWVIVLVGIWQIFAPWIWGYSWRAAAVWSDVVTGIFLTIGALSVVTYRSTWPAWWSIVLGAWLIVSPFALGYSFIPRAQANDIVVGVIVIVLGIIAALSKPVMYGGTPVERL